MRLLRPFVSGAVAAGLSAFGHAVMGVLYLSGAVRPSPLPGARTEPLEPGTDAPTGAAGERRGWRRLRIPRRRRPGEGTPR